MNKVRVCIIGAGRAGEVHGDIYNMCVPNSIIVAIVDPDIEKARKLGNKYNLDKKFAFKDFEDALSYTKFDATVIASPTFTHCLYTKMSAQNKINVFCEKPMAIKEKDCLEMINVCNKANVILQIGFMRRFDEGFINAKYLLESGQIGEPIIIKSEGRGPSLPIKWALNIENSNGNLAEVNSHDFDSIRWFSSSEYKRIYAVAKNSKNSEIREKYPLFYDNAIVSIVMKNQVFGQISSVCPCDYGYDARTEVVGTKGVLFIGSIRENKIVICTRKKQIVTPQILSWKERFYDAYIAEDRHFIDCVINNRKPRVTGNDGKEAVAAVIAANMSILTKVPVDIE